MKNYGKIEDNKDIVTKEYVDKIGKPELRISYTIDTFSGELDVNYPNQTKLIPTTFFTKEDLEKYQIILTNENYIDLKIENVITTLDTSNAFIGYFTCSPWLEKTFDSDSGLVLNGMLNPCLYYGYDVGNNQSAIIFGKDKYTNDILYSYAGGIVSQNSMMALLTKDNYGIIANSSGVFIGDVVNSNTLKIETNNHIVDLASKFKIVNLADGTEDTDAINLKQLNEVKELVPTKTSEIENDSGFTVKKSYTVILSGTWSGETAPYTQSVTVDGILAADNPHIAPIFSETLATAKAEQEAWNCVSKAVTTANTITFTCFEDKPTVALNLQIEVIR